jgi:hypothetical protein
MAGFQGDQGDQGDQGYLGNLSSLGTGAGGLFVDRADFPFVATPHVGPANTERRRFGDRNWAADWQAWCALADFGRLDWQTELGRVVRPPEAPTQDEWDELFTAAREERADALCEIVRQDSEFISYFLAAMGGAPGSRPATMLVFHIANLVATMTVMHFKYLHDRPRPSHIRPGLLPPIPVPGHASYPSGHATQAHLFALCTQRVLPDEHRDEIGVVLRALAERIARNREIAGVHFRSDTHAGADLASQVYDMLVRENADGTYVNPKFIAAVEAASLEWI